MKKYGLQILIVLIIIFAGYRLFVVREKSPSTHEKQKPIAISANTGPFNESFTRLLTAYYSMKDALVDSDTAKASAASFELAKQADSLKIDDIKGDTTGAIKETAMFYIGTISASVKTLTAEKNIAGKRKEFEVITDAVWTLTRTVRYDGQKVYYQYCPMAFDNKGAYWLSSKREIRNPYFGEKMLRCGEIADSLDYSKR